MQTLALIAKQQDRVLSDNKPSVSHCGAHGIRSIDTTGDNNEFEIETPKDLPPVYRSSSFSLSLGKDNVVVVTPLEDEVSLPESPPLVVTAVADVSEHDMSTDSPSNVWLAIAYDANVALMGHVDDDAVWVKISARIKEAAESEKCRHNRLMSPVNGYYLSKEEADTNVLSGKKKDVTDKPGVGSVRNGFADPEDVWLSIAADADSALASGADDAVWEILRTKLKLAAELVL